MSNENKDDTGVMGRKPTLTLDKLKKGSHDGLTLQEMADKHGTTYEAVWRASSKHKIYFKRASSGARGNTKAEIMLDLFIRKCKKTVYKTNAQIARDAGVTTPRVNQLIKEITSKFKEAGLKF